MMGRLMRTGRMALSLILTLSAFGIGSTTTEQARGHESQPPNAGIDRNENENNSAPV